MNNKPRVAIIGAGILGLAHAYVWAKRRYEVHVFERSLLASGASIRNFGMLWPIGQPSGPLTELAMLSRRIWLEILKEAELHFVTDGSLHLAYHDDEEAVAREFASLHPERGQWISSNRVMQLSGHVVNPRDLLGALHSPHEVVVDPRQVLAYLPGFLASKYGVTFHFQTAVTDVHRLPHGVKAGLTIICGGDDFETLYPEVFASSGITRCKLQMLRTEPQPYEWRLGPALAAGLTMRFYKSFADCPSLPALRERIARDMPEYDDWGIHVMASQGCDGTITIGDSHEYGLDVSIFNRERIDQLILEYLARFVRLPQPAIDQRWHGVYAKHPDRPIFTAEPEPGVRIVTAPGGAGMTLSFGLAETFFEDPGRSF